VAADVYEALDDLFAQSGLNALLQGGGFFVGPVEGDVAMPYCQMTPTGEAPMVRSNRRKYSDDSLQLAIVHTTFRNARTLIRTITDVVEEADLVVTGMGVLSCLAGNRTYQQEVGFHRIIQDFTIKVSEPRKRHP
jgi:hypothetical protein